MPPTCSLIITTYNWEAALERVLASVLRQHRLPDEVLLADDGSGPATADVIARFAERSPVPVRHIWHEDRGFRLAAIRNRALAAARGEYVIMLDGDMFVHPRFVYSHVRFARPGSYVQGSRVMLREEVTARVLTGELEYVSAFMPGIGNRANALHAPLLSRLYTGSTGPLRRTRGCNLAVWRSDVERVNGFNEDMVGWGREDSEFVARLLHAGVRRRNLKFAAVAYHLHHRTRSQDSVTVNHAIYEQVVHERLTRCAHGLDAHPRDHGEPLPPALPL